jgi:membrane-bound ClpP family serine protease
VTDSSGQANPQVAPHMPAAQISTANVPAAQISISQIAAPGDLVTVGKVRWVGRVVLVTAALAAVAAAVLALNAVADLGVLRWGTGVLLLLVLVGTGLLCAHAGGHAWFVPVPAVVLVAVWAFGGSTRSAEAGWWLVALGAAASAGAVIVGSTALRQRVGGTLTVLAPVRGATGVAISELTPVGVVRVAGEYWSAESVSGTLPPGAPVHVLRVNGVRLEVWSEVGVVPDASMFDIQEDQL